MNIPRIIALLCVTLLGSAHATEYSQEILKIAERISYEPQAVADSPIIITNGTTITSKHLCARSRPKRILLEAVARP
ncbi:Unannotated [Lentimonas sp. CC19]|uniref:hypothetical protein n=1 Tax=Lentimonas sp. CC19 TaxID=2676097 RepID=UPI001328426A|nr:hypothetical protein [Lentimonas sp. CC19]CAA6693710.1 Unannotated [Lentimonas sp. CC10]CAA6696347.1 Unannotated [Lentimonas sp. CC19]CAA7071660.1 Unannotated [Lentimonas sp. CC11]